MTNGFEQHISGINAKPRLFEITYHRMINIELLPIAVSCLSRSVYVALNWSKWMIIESLRISTHREVLLLHVLFV